MPIELHFAQKSAIFRPGDCVTGHVVVISQNSDRTDGIELEWRGRVDLVTKNSQQATFQVFRTAQILNQNETKREYLDWAQVGCRYQSDDDAEVSDRERRIPFKHRLPSPIPPSHRGAASYAQIRYSVEATLKRNWEDGVITLSTEKPFNVIPVQELSQAHMGQIKLNHAVRAMMCCCCFFPSVEVGIALNKRGYYPGEDVAIQMAVVNNRISFPVDVLIFVGPNVRQIFNIKNVTDSGSEISGINLKLLQLVSIMCAAGYSYQRVVVQELNLHQIIIPSSSIPYTMPMKKMPIPATTPTYDTGKDIMSVKYEIQCIICLPSVYDDIFLTLPVVIGTYPEALTSLMRNINILPQKGTMLRPIPSADLDSPEFASSIEEVREFPSMDNLHSTQYDNNNSDDSDSSDGEAFEDLSHGIVNPGYQSSSNIESTSAGPSSPKKQPKVIAYELLEPNKWLVHYKRCGSLLKSSKTAQTTEPLSLDNS